MSSKFNNEYFYNNSMAFMCRDIDIQIEVKYL